MPNLEPSYLRYVHDQLATGTLSPENAAALPEGLIGLYEQEFSQNIPVNKRQRLLNHLATWALFKGPVSAAMASKILNVSEGEVKDLIDRYSSWFNSPESGRYQLYHERLRVFILQKLNDKEIHALNEQIISYLESAVNQADDSEDEKYALQFLHNHMALESMLGIDYERLHNYVNQESLWERQIKVSKGYEWSQNAVQQGIKEGARRNHEMNTIRSTVNSVKLMTQEQNSAEAIIELLNEGDYHSALKRAESWEGDRQFKLYLLFIHELTIGTSKEASFSKEACKAVLEAIDQTPEDHSILDWTKFYPELAIYKYYEQLLKMELDGMVIWRRGKYELEKLLNTHSVKRFYVKILAKGISDRRKKIKVYESLIKLYSENNELLIVRSLFKEVEIIASTFEKQLERDNSYNSLAILLLVNGYKNECFRISKKIVGDRQSSDNYSEIAKELFRLGEIKNAVLVAERIIKDNIRQNLYGYFCIEYGRKGETGNALIYYHKISSDRLKLKDDTLIDLCVQLSKIGLKEEALDLCWMCSDYQRSYLYMSIANIAYTMGDENVHVFCVEESIKNVEYIPVNELKSKAYLSLSREFQNQGNSSKSIEFIELALNSAYKIEKYKSKFDALLSIIRLLFKMEEIELINCVSLEINEALNNIDNYEKGSCYYDVSNMFIEFMALSEALEYAKKIPDGLVKEYNGYYIRLRSIAYANISALWYKYGDINKSEDVMSLILDRVEILSILIIRYEKYALTQDSIMVEKVVADILNILAEITLQELALRDIDVCHIFRNLGDKESLEKCENIINKKLQIRSSQISKDIIVANMIKSTLECGDLSEALSKYKLLNSGDVKWDIFRILFEIFIENLTEFRSYVSIGQLLESKGQFSVGSREIDIFRQIFDYYKENKNHKALIQLLLIIDEYIPIVDPWDAFDLQRLNYEVLRFLDRQIDANKKLLEILEFIHLQSDNNRIFEKEYALAVLAKLIDSSSISAKDKSYFDFDLEFYLFKANDEDKLSSFEENRFANFLIDIDKLNKKDVLSITYMEVDHLVKEILLLNQTNNTGLIEEMDRCFSRLLSAHYTEDKKWLLFGKIAAALSQSNKTKLALKYLDAISLRRNAYSEAIKILKNCLERGDIASADILVNYCVGSPSHEVSVSLLAKFYAGHNHLLKALGLLRGKEFSREYEKVFRTIGANYTLLMLFEHKVFEEFDVYKLNIFKGVLDRQLDNCALSEELFVLLNNCGNNLSMYLSILEYFARIECFFLSEGNDEKLDMLSEVLDIEDWRRISASFSNN